MELYIMNDALSFALKFRRFKDHCTLCHDSIQVIALLFTTRGLLQLVGVTLECVLQDNGIVVDTFIQHLFQLSTTLGEQLRLVRALSGKAAGGKMALALGN
jgi:hypothetical protein